LGLNQQLTNVDFGNTQSPVGLPGDYNNDAVVDLVDYVLWRKAMNQTVPPFSGADGDGDGVVDQDDYGVWRAHFGMSLAGGGGGSAAFVAAVDVAGGSSHSAAASLFTADGDARSGLALQHDVETLAARENAARRLIFEADSEPARGHRGEFRVNHRSAMPPRVGDAALLAWLSGQPSRGSGAESANSAPLPHETQAEAAAELGASVDIVFESLGRLAVR
jgi:hypothetical protein